MLAVITADENQAPVIVDLVIFTDGKARAMAAVNFLANEADDHHDQDQGSDNDRGGDQITHVLRYEIHLSRASPVHQGPGLARTGARVNGQCPPGTKGRFPALTKSLYSS